ncbi:MAG: lmo0937 family membrane protein [Cyanobacteriota bacterium ELA615]
MFDLAWSIIVVLFILWLIGFSIHIGGSLIHLLLVLVLIGIVYNLFTKRSI